MSYDRVFRLYPRFRRYYEEKEVRELYAFLSSPNNIDKMLTANDDYKLPALAGVIKDIESRLQSNSINLCNNEIRQLLGCMIKEIIQDYGYEIIRQKHLNSQVSTFIKTAAIYSYNPEKAKKRLAKNITVHNI